MKKNVLVTMSTVVGFFIGSCIMATSGLKTYAAETLNVYQPAEEEVVISENTGNSKDLLEGFMHKQGRSGTTAMVRNSNRRATLNAVNGYIYDQLKTKIVSIANGQEASSEMTISVPLKTLLGAAWKDQYTAADLGVTALFDGNGDPTDETNVAILNLMGFNVETIVYAIRADCPYELYWFGNMYGYLPMSFAYDGTRTFVSLLENSTVTIALKVSAEYSVSGNEGTTDVSTAKCLAVKSAANYANQIISNNASKSDYEKLKAYNDIICELNTYNTAAMQSGVPYGNPWQIIYVFDQNPSTNVVCEGYAKAFKYLCDGSSFTSDQIECYLITGQLSGGTGSGPHMWNHVRMNNGKIYLVDVTNNDYGSIGYPYKLFLTGGKDSNEDTWLEANNATAYYVFDNETKALFSAAELTWSETDYSLSDAPSTPQNPSENQNSNQGTDAQSNTPVNDDTQTQQGNTTGNDNNQSQQSNTEKQDSDSAKNDDANQPDRGQDDSNVEDITTPINSKAKSGTREYKTSTSGKASITADRNKKTKSINVPATVKLNGAVYKITEIKSGVYKNNKKITKATFGPNIEKIGANAFNGCSKLGKITIYANNLKSVGKNAFKGVKKNATVTVYAKDKKTYDKAVKMLKKAGLKKAKFKFKAKK